jgi:RNA polymerase sigma-70 factor (ECF subfamily)
MDEGAAVPIAEPWEERRFLLDVAHRMLGDPGAAERVVDETYQRWYGLSDAARRRIAVPRSWLAETVGGICSGRGEAAYGQPSEAGEEAGEEAGRTVLDALRSWRTRATAPHRHDGVVRAVCRACVTEDGELLTSLLCPDVTAFFDGGGKVRAPTGPDRCTAAGRSPTAC